jgi:phospholipid/cholesterol/gamma-HCH transport system substrate-binding protein
MSPFAGDDRFRRIERRVGIFVVAALAGMALAVIAIGLRQGVFIPKTTVYCFADSGKGLFAGQPVVFRGFTIGKVGDVRLTPEGRVEILLRIQTKYMQWVRADSVARIEKELLIGDAVIVVTQGSPEQPMVEDEGVIAFEREREIGEIVGQAVAEARPVLEEIRGLVAYVSSPEGDVKRSLRNIRDLTAGLDETRTRIETRIEKSGGDVSALARDLRGMTRTIETELVPEVRALINATGTAAATVGRVAEGVDSSLPDILEKLQAAIEDIEAAARDVREAVPGALDVLDEGGALVDETRGVVRKVDRSWLLGGAAAPPTRAVEVDSRE